MELKQFKITHYENRTCLLIVPYGIETGYGQHGKALVLLLIVPYGIETQDHQE